MAILKKVNNIVEDVHLEWEVSVGEIAGYELLAPVQHSRHHTHRAPDQYAKD